jgi:hypothetical protein
MTGDYMGYWSGTAWTAYINSDGHFQFLGDADNKITWDGDDFGICTTGTIALTTSGGSISLAGGDITMVGGSISLTSSGAISLAAGGGVTLTGGDSSPAFIKFNGSSYSTQLYATASGQKFYICPATANTVDFKIGYYINDSGVRFKSVVLFGDTVVLNGYTNLSLNNNGLLTPIWVFGDLKPKEGYGLQLGDGTPSGTWSDRSKIYQADTYSYWLPASGARRTQFCLHRENCVCLWWTRNRRSMQKL